MGTEILSVTGTDAASCNGLGPINFRGRASQSRESTGCQGPCPRGLGSKVGQRSCWLKLQKIKSLKQETVGKGNSNPWSTAKTICSHGMIMFTHRETVKRDGPFPMKEQGHRWRDCSIKTAPERPEAKQNNSAIPV